MTISGLNLVIRALTSAATLRPHNQSYGSHRRKTADSSTASRRWLLEQNTQPCRTTRNCCYGPGWIRIRSRQTTDNQTHRQLPQKPI